MTTLLTAMLASVASEILNGTVTSAPFAAG